MQDATEQQITSDGTFITIGDAALRALRALEDTFDAPPSPTVEPTQLELPLDD